MESTAHEGRILGAVSSLTEEVRRVSSDNVTLTVASANDLLRCRPHHFSTERGLGVNLTQELPSLFRFRNQAVHVENAELEVMFGCDLIQSFANRPHVRESDAGNLLSSGFKAGLRGLLLQLPM